MGLRFFHILVLLLTTLEAFAHDPGHGSAFRFIENKNQWDDKVRYRAVVPSGTLFLEKNCFTYHLVDEKFRNHLRSHQTSEYPDSLKMRGHVFKVNFENSNSDVIVSAEGEHSDYYNYFLGKDPSKWASKVKAFDIVNYQNLYNGIDLKIYSQNNNLKYDFVVLPNMDPNDIKIKYDGLDQLYLNEGSLVLKTSLGNITEKKPYAYQQINSKLISVPCHYVLQGNKVSFAFPKGYNKNYKLIIDPLLIFSTYSGSHADNFGYTATPDSEGFLYAGSSVFENGYPTTIGAYQVDWAGGTGYYGQTTGVDIAITKYDTSGTFRIYSTYLGGEGEELPHSMITNENDELLIFGTTGSAGFPMVNAFDNTFGEGTDIALGGLGVRFINGSDIFVAKLSRDGSALMASTYVGGSGNDGLNLSSSLRYNYADEVRGEIDIDKEGNIYVATCTQSTDFPILGNNFQTNYGGGFLDGCVLKMDRNLNSILWSSYLGGEFSDAAYSIAIDDSSDVYIAGGTWSSAFPTTAGVLYPAFQGTRSDGFITHVSKNGKNILNSTYYGSPVYDQIYFVELDKYNNVYVFGQTEATNSDADRFIKNAAFKQINSGQFITKLNSQLDSVIWSTVFGTGSGLPNISPTAFLVDVCNKIYLSGWGGTSESNEFLQMYSQFNPLQPRPFNMLTTSGSYPPTDYYQSSTDSCDFYLFVLEDDASAVNYASFFGGNQSREHVDGGTSRFDKKGKIYQAMCAGCGFHSDMPLKPPYNPGNFELPALNESDCNIGVFKMDFRIPAVVADFSANPVCLGDTTYFHNKSLIKAATTFKWIFGDGNTSTAINPSHLYLNGGTYKVTLIAFDNTSCNLSDTIYKTLYVSGVGNLSNDATADQYTIYKGKRTTLHANPNSGFLYNWTPASSLNNASSPNPIASPDTTTTYTLTTSDPLVPRCATIDTVTINVIEIFCKEPHIFIPDAFTPNDDGKNDLLYVRSTEIAEMYFTVYNRWGEKVFETKDQNIGWDGIFKGMKADPGVFVYYLEVTCVDDQKFFKKGNVTLIR